MPHRVEHRTTRTAASKPDTRTHGEEFREHAGTHGDGVARRCGVDRRLDRREVVRHAEHHAGGVRGITAAGLRYVHAPRHVVRALRDGDRLGVRDHHRERFGACGDDVGLLASAPSLGRRGRDTSPPAVRSSGEIGISSLYACGVGVSEDTGSPPSDGAVATGASHAVRRSAQERTVERRVTSASERNSSKRSNGADGPGTGSRRGRDTTRFPLVVVHPSHETKGSGQAGCRSRSATRRRSSRSAVRDRTPIGACACSAPWAPTQGASRAALRASWLPHVHVPAPSDPWHSHRETRGG